MQPEKLWLFCDMKWMSKCHIHSTSTSQTVMKKEWKPWCYLLEFTTTWDASLIK
jgi:hypothetical protein